MPYITPFTHVTLCRVDGLDAAYKNTMYFEDEHEQYNFFSSKAIRPDQNDNNIYLLKQNIIEVRKVGFNRVRIELPIETVCKANYMRIYNQGYNENTPVEYENKSLYAFITDYRYISESVTEIEFELDVIQSYLFDYEELACLVEREHTDTDFYGEHIATEPIDLGALKAVKIEETKSFDNYMIVVATAYTGS